MFMVAAKGGRKIEQTRCVALECRFRPQRKGTPYVKNERRKCYMAEPSHEAALFSLQARETSLRNFSSGFGPKSAPLIGTAHLAKNGGLV